MERALVLSDHRPGSLAEKHATYLFERTGGRIGSLSQVVRAAAVEAIAMGCEAIDRRLLDSIEVDFAPEGARQRVI